MMGFLHGVPYMFKLSKRNKDQIKPEMYKQFESFFLLCFQENDWQYNINPVITAFYERQD